MESTLTNSERRELKARAQLLDPAVRLGHEGANEALFKELEAAFSRSDLVKVKFGDFKEEKERLIPEIAEKSGSEVIMRVGHVAVFYRQRPASEEA